MKVMAKSSKDSKQTHIQVRLERDIHDDIVDLSDSSKDTISDVIRRGVAALKREKGLVDKR